MRGSRVPGVLLALAGLAIGLEATTFETVFLTDPVGPKALPLLAGALLFLAGAHAAWRPSAAPEPIRRGWTLVGAGAAFVAYSLLLGTLGFVLSTTLLVAALSHLYGAPPRRGIPVAALFALALWALFVHTLALPLPIGSLWMR